MSYLKTSITGLDSKLESFIELSTIFLITGPALTTLKPPVIKAGPEIKKMVNSIINTEDQNQSTVIDVFNRDIK